jgi:glycosyltransferase involved in cell wall biosynthesis
MKIAINARWLIPEKLEGFGWYTMHVVQRLSRLLPDAVFYLITDRKLSDHLVENINVRYYVLPPPARHPYLWYIWNEISVPLLLKKLKPDLYFSPDGFIPSGLKIPTLATLHDLNFEADHNFLKPNIQQYYKKHYRKAANQATHLLTVSSFSKNDIVERYGIDPSKITVTQNGPQAAFSDMRHIKRSTRQRYAAGRPYFLFVGAQNPRKNLHRILMAFDMYASLPGSNHHLVIVGEKMHWDQDINEAWAALEQKDRVHFTGRLSTYELNRVFSAATALVFPSLYEGFGMPILEAFLACTPVITSRVTAMPEIAGDAALLVDPTSIEAITDAMRSLSANPDLCTDYAARGLARAELFSWDKTARTTAKIIKDLTDASAAKNSGNH